MKLLRKLTFILLGIVFVFYLVAVIFHLDIKTTSSVWVIVLYVAGGLAFIGAVICTIIIMIWRFIQLIKSSFGHRD